jgi:hypothetical protein
MHGPDVDFYAKSALESAHLPLCSGLTAHEGELRVHAIAELGSQSACSTWRSVCWSTRRSSAYLFQPLLAGI